MRLNVLISVLLILIAGVGLFFMQDIINRITYEPPLTIEEVKDGLYIDFKNQTGDSEISEEDMVRILTEPKNALVKQYRKLFAIDGVELTFEKAALEAIAELAIQRKTGARGLRSIIEEVMVDIMFDLPDFSGYEVVITEDVVKNGAEPLRIKKTKKSA